MASPDTRSLILDAVLDVASEHALSGLNVEAVAARAGVSRQTVYRHFANREHLVEQAILREEHLLIEQMLAAADGEVTLVAAVAAAGTTALRLARAHPVLSRVLAREPASLLPYLLLGRGPVIAAAEPAVEDLLRRYRPSLPADRLRLAADLATRLLASYVVSPDPQVDDQTLAGELAGVVVHLVDRRP